MDYFTSVQSNTCLETQYFIYNVGEEKTTIVFKQKNFSPNQSFLTQKYHGIGKTMV